LKNTTKFILLICLTLSLFFSAQAAKLSPEKAGKIEVPMGKIAYIHDKDLWVMDWDGKNQFKVVTALNAAGKISWAPDGKRIAFSRRGTVKTEGPDYLGGSHRVYDIFIGYLDSAHTNTNWWYRLIGGLGARNPEWSADGSQIIFTNDLNAHLAAPLYPNYQTCFTDTIGGSYEIVRTDYKDSLFSTLMPTRGPGNQYAYVVYKGVNPLGIVISSLDKKTLTQDDFINGKVKLIPKVTGPAWSPDGKWLAYVDISITNQAIHIVKPDLSEKYIVYKPTAGLNLQTFPLSWSPDSKWLTFGTSDGSLWIIDITGNQLKQITGPGLNSAPAWSKTK
jgi:dipeptidyl aminopeptidase/acylaminoacyl peptidase